MVFVNHIVDCQSPFVIFLFAVVHLLPETKVYSILGNYGECVNDITRQFLANPAQVPDSTCMQAATMPFVMP